MEILLIILAGLAAFILMIGGLYTAINILSDAFSGGSGWLFWVCLIVGIMGIIGHIKEFVEKADENFGIRDGFFGNKSEPPKLPKSTRVILGDGFIVFVGDRILDEDCEIRTRKGFVHTVFFLNETHSGLRIIRS